MSRKMSDKLKGKRVLVLGGETTLGRALAVGLAEAGADIAIATLSPGSEAEFAVNSALNELWALGREGVALLIEASDAGQVREAVRRAEDEVGRLDAAAAVVPEEEVVALDGLRAALGGRRLVVLAGDAAVKDALREVADGL